MALSQSERQIAPLVYPPPGRADLDAITEAESRRDAETKTALSRLALNDLEILALLRELIAETRAEHAPHGEQRKEVGITWRLM